MHPVVTPKYKNHTRAPVETFCAYLDSALNFLLKMYILTMAGLVIKQGGSRTTSLACFCDQILLQSL